jgi:ABC-type dipeptide/oligopeptide/nickel transport system permease component
MWRFALWESGRFALGLFGALLMASAISALSVPDAAGGFAAAAGERFLAFMRLDLGTSAISGMSAAQELAQHGPATAALLLLGAIVAILFGVPLGFLLGTAAMRRAAAPLIQIVSAAPVFVAGLALAFAARHLFGWPPIDGEFPTAAALLHPDADVLRVALLPVLTVGFAGTAAVQLALRRAAAEVQHEPFRLGLKRLGLSSLEIDRNYVAPLVFSGLLAGLGEVMLALLSAAVVAEWVFRAPGAADLFVKSVALHDWNVAALVLFFFAAATLAVNFAGRLAAHALTEAGRGQ